MPSSERIMRVAAIHDISCFGRCALTVVIPVLSAMGIQAVPVPTALLSTHTGGFDDLYFRDLTDDMVGIEDHFSRLGLEFDAIYTGFLGSERQISVVSDFLCRFGKKDCLRFIDPVMGDDGALYSTYNDRLAAGMRQLCKSADIITPNLTEACCLTGTEYEDTKKMSETDAEAFAADICIKMKSLTDADIVITGINSCNGNIGCYTFTGGHGSFFSRPRVGTGYPGTGELFASVMLGKLLKKEGFLDAAIGAADFTRRAVEYSLKFTSPVREGVTFEPLLGDLAYGNDRITM